MFPKGSEGKGRDGGGGEDCGWELAPPELVPNLAVEDESVAVGGTFH